MTAVSEAFPEIKKLHVLGKIVHEANRAFCETIGDTSQVPWAELSLDLRASTIDGIKQVILNPSITSSQIHETWMEKKKEQGWVYGETKDEEAKTHPSMVPYDQLDARQRFKDALFINIVLAYVNFK